MTSPSRLLLGVCAAVFAVGMGGCQIRQDMADQPKNRPLSPSPFFDDGRASRPLEPGVIARGHLRDDLPKNPARRTTELIDVKNLVNHNRAGVHLHIAQASAFPVLLVRDHHSVLAAQAHHAEEVLEVVLRADDQPTEVMHPGKESFHSPIAPVTPQPTAILRGFPTLQ